MTSPTNVKAVIFDIGGVVLKSPFIAIAQYEKTLGLPKNYINCSIAARGKESAWQRFERGQLELHEFYQAFTEDLTDVDIGNLAYKEYCRRRNLEVPRLPETLPIDGRELFGQMMRGGGEYDPRILRALQTIRASKKFKVIALTNNFSKLPGPPPPKEELQFLGWDSLDGPAPSHLRALFDDFCDSSEMGMRKPDPEFYIKACKRNSVQPAEAVFLDDIGTNLKAAADLGMTTIHVELYKSLEAVRQLEVILNMDLGSSDSEPKSKL